MKVCTSLRRVALTLFSVPLKMRGGKHYSIYRPPCRGEDNIFDAFLLTGLVPKDLPSSFPRGKLVGTLVQTCPYASIYQFMKFLFKKDSVRCKHAIRHDVYNFSVIVREIDNKMFIPRG